MAPKKSLLSRMKANPANDWKIGNLTTVCKQIGITIAPPRGGGSHYTIHSPYVDGILTVPAKRPIKPIYIRQFVALCGKHAEQSNEERK